MSPQEKCTPVLRDIPADVRTPCLVVLEEGVTRNLRRTIAACGGKAARLMPHVKTHRAPWVVKLCLDAGVRVFKAATVREVAMVLGAGASRVLWAYPTANAGHIRDFVELAAAHPAAALGALVDSHEVVPIWQDALAGKAPNVQLLVDLDVGMGRTGIAINDEAIEFARWLHNLGRFGGWHAYDGHLQQPERQLRMEAVQASAAKVSSLKETSRRLGMSDQVVAGGSYTFDIWPIEVADYVTPGSWTYSSDQHDRELKDLGWAPAAFVLATVMSKRGATRTLDAGAKAITPDKPLKQRFRWPGQILLMSEEHVVIESDDMAVGDRVLLMPSHACTTAYLYDQALVRTIDGNWEYRPQLGSRR